MEASIQMSCVSYRHQWLSSAKDRRSSWR